MVVKYPSRRALLSCVEQGPLGVRLFAPTSEPLALRERVRLKVTFGDCVRNFYVEGRVASEPERSSGRLGHHILLRTPEERRAFSHLLAFCAQNKEAPRRVSVWLPCTLRAGGQTLAGNIRDLSLGGLFIAGSQVRSSSALSARAPVEVVLKQGPFGLSSVVLPAQVVWAGEKEGVPGVGAEWMGGGTQSQVLALLKRHGGK